jgi:hypothetical protein
VAEEPPRPRGILMESLMGIENAARRNQRGPRW